jgi:thioredoxin reductase
MSDSHWDVVVVGGGPAGLSGALWLARYRRSVLVLDDDRPRNEAAWGVHGFPGIQDPDPAVLRSRIREQALEAGAEFEGRRAASIQGTKDEFTVHDDQGQAMEARRVLLAYGRQDRIPEIPGLLELYGRSVFHCPDCDGPSVEGGRVGVLGHDRGAAILALYLLTWAERTVLLTNGLRPELDETARGTLQKHGVALETSPVRSLEGEDGRLRRARLEEGEVELDALFFHWGSDPTSGLGPATGCECSESGRIIVEASSLQSSVEGIHAAGDIVGRPYLAVTAVADGVRAALAIHRSLLPSEFHL